jgi:hypothetical protein
VKPTGKEGPREVTLALAPAYVLEGAVTYADTGKPAPQVRLLMAGESGRFQGPTERMDLRTDTRGRFRVSAPVGERYTVIAYAPEGTPYLPLVKEFGRPKPDVIKKDIQLALPRGVLVRGRVTESPSGKPVAGAAVEFEPNHDNNPYFRDDIRPVMAHWRPLSVSDVRGEFAVAVLPGPGHLLVTAATNDYVHVEIGTKKLYGQRVNPDWRNYYDSLVALNLKPQAGPHEVKVTLRRGVTLAGQVVGPDGNPVACWCTGRT